MPTKSGTVPFQKDWITVSKSTVSINWLFTIVVTRVFILHPCTKCEIRMSPLQKTAFSVSALIGKVTLRPLNMVTGFLPANFQLATPFPYSTNWAVGPTGLSPTSRMKRYTFRSSDRLVGPTQATSDWSVRPVRPTGRTDSSRTAHICQSNQCGLLAD